jgi:hypothetical protein
MMENLEKLHALKYDWKLIGQILDVPDYMECKYRWQRMQRDRLKYQVTDSDWEPVKAEPVKASPVKANPTRKKKEEIPPSSGDDGELDFDISE